LSGVATAGALIPAPDGLRPRPEVSAGSGFAPPREPGPEISVDGGFDRLRERWREISAGSGFDAGAEPYATLLARLGRAAARHRDSMAPARTSLWPDLPFPSLAGTPARLRAMARAYALTGEASLAEAVAEGLDHYRRQVYARGADPEGNWWDWEIGVPARLLDAAVLIGPHLSDRQAADLADAVDHFVPACRLEAYEGTSTGANRVDLCTVTLLRALVRARPDRAKAAAHALTPVLAYVSEGDGFYRDGSFIQHTGVPYQGGYGVVALQGLATLFAVLRGSPWEIPVRDRQVVLASVERSFAPFVHDGACLDLVGGRGVGRRPFYDHERGHRVAAAILLLAESAPAAEQARWRAMVKGWAVRDTYRPMIDTDDLGFRARLAAILKDEAIPAAAEPVGHRLMPMSARAVHRRPDWCAALSMASHRIAHYEHGNGENPRGWHTGAGMLYWWGRGHGDQYSQGFWPGVDRYRLPGTTVSTRRLPDGAGEAWGGARTPWRWVGGATDGVHATVGQHLSGLESSLEAFKSWFFLDDAVVCLGAGISCADGVPVETIVDNRRTVAPLTVDGRGWAHLGGHGGYVVRQGVLRHTRTTDFATLWLDHGRDPDSAAYVYLLLPNAGLARTRARAADPGWPHVLANTHRQQGIGVSSLGLTAVNFFTAGSAGPLTASAPCAVLVREHGDGTATVTVSDPRRDLDELSVTWDRPVARVLRRDPLIRGVALDGGLTLEFGRLADRGGASKTIAVELGEL